MWFLFMLINEPEPFLLRWWFLILDITVSSKFYFITLFSSYRWNYSVTATECFIKFIQVFCFALGYLKTVKSSMVHSLFHLWAHRLSEFGSSKKSGHKLMHFHSLVSTHASLFLFTPSVDSCWMPTLLDLYSSKHVFCFFPGSSIKFIPVVMLDRHLPNV